MRILIEIHEGQIVRNLLENGLLPLLTQNGAEVLLVTPGACVPAFVERYAQNGVMFRDLALLSRTGLTRSESYEFAGGKWASKRGLHALRRVSWEWWGEPDAAKRADVEKALIDEWHPDIVVSTHLSQIYGRGLVAAARIQGIPTLGNLNSWDNAWKGLRIRPDIVTCWSQNNCDEISRLASYRAQDIKVIGATAFDAYFASDSAWTREQLCEQLGLDADYPILVFATLGQFSQQIDETNPLEMLLHALDRGELPDKTQVVLRMHPWSRDMYFKQWIEHPRVTVSRYETYYPGLGWSPTREEAVLAGNLLRHADTVISPGSTMSIEPAIFDTPTIIPVFNEYMPEVFEQYFRQTWLNQHFGRLYKNDWIPIVRSADTMIEAIRHALNDRSWYSAGRQHIREELLGPLDGKATERLSQSILDVASKSKHHV